MAAWTKPTEHHIRAKDQEDAGGEGRRQEITKDGRHDASSHKQILQVWLCEWLACSPKDSPRTVVLLKLYGVVVRAQDMRRAKLTPGTISYNLPLGRALQTPTPYELKRSVVQAAERVRTLQ